MGTGRSVVVAFVSLSWCLLAGCGEPSSEGGPKPPAHPATLEALLQEAVAARKAGDGARVLALTLSMIPTTSDLRQVLRAGPETDAFLAAFEAKDIAPSDPRARGLSLAPSDPDQAKRTEIRVHQATTEELAAYERGTVAFQEFPGGMRRFAERVAAPGRTWYCAEFLEPGHESGTKYTCFTRLGERFLFVVRPWRALPVGPVTQIHAITDLIAVGGGSLTPEELVRRVQAEATAAGWPEAKDAVLRIQGDALVVRAPEAYQHAVAAYLGTLRDSPDAK